MSIQCRGWICHANLTLQLLLFGLPKKVLIYQVCGLKNCMCSPCSAELGQIALTIAYIIGRMLVAFSFPASPMSSMNRCFMQVFRNVPLSLEVTVWTTWRHARATHVRGIARHVGTSFELLPSLYWHRCMETSLSTEGHAHHEMTWVKNV